MFKCEKIFLDRPNPITSLPYEWELVLADGRRLPWQGFYTGPLSLTDEEVAILCQKLLGIDITELEQAASQELQPVTSLVEGWTGLIMHSTTPDVNSLKGDVDKLMRGYTPKDYTAYKETRSSYLAHLGDLALGRISAWKTAVSLESIDSIEIPGIDYYYLSHALLLLAECHLSSPTPQLTQIVEFLRINSQTVVRLYALETEMQIFLVWLKRQAGIERLYMDANSPAVARMWNSKSVLHPNIQDALLIKNIPPEISPKELLKIESRATLLYKDLGLTIPLLPGYTILRVGMGFDAFVEQIIQAARLLRQRYRLPLGCLKASESGDGARIFPGLDLTDESALEALAESAYHNGDAYVLEAHVTYLTVNVGGQKLNLTPSAHIRWGQLAEGLTLQITEGSSWKGNIYIDENTSELLGISQAHYQIIIGAMTEFIHAFQKQKLGLVIAGIDFAIGSVGGIFGDEIIVAAQDPNICFNGAECLRVFASKMKERYLLTQDEPLYAATQVIQPSLDCTLAVLREFTNSKLEKNCQYDTIASIPGRWGMIGAIAKTPTEAFIKVLALTNELKVRGLAV